MLISAINIVSIIRRNFLYTVALFEFQSETRKKTASGVLFGGEEKAEKATRRIFCIDFEDVGDFVISSWK